ncbi:extracellular solute-binding protein [Actinosynnema pretiosum subsp. pretiosum]|uniref:Extracellular solute-binding protein n=1 Tax=Actinosynnema pretiosum subsp. pretiosum TaxID=103721 RepID=A0AA45L830_9PSEU|nr:putative sugar ABC transporter, substrate-binding protein, putative [Actinosynnema pretiosum subsp. pretiosum]QUF05051.1 extracellular solute-binding protein [Actinosynnema pretiosum subsp. pretiosum]
MRTTPAALAVLIALLPALPACSAAPADGGEVLTVVGWKGGGGEEARLPELNAAFERAHPGVRVEHHYVGPGNYETYNNPKLASGTAADVIMVDKAKTRTWTDQGYLADLSDQPWVPAVHPELAPFTTVDGRTRQFTQENIGIGLYANLDLLASAGITEVPRDWPTLLATLDTLREKGKPGLLVPNKGGWGGVQLALALAVNRLAPTWSADYNTGRARFGPDWAPVVDELKRAVASGAVDGKLMLGLDACSDALTEFKAGRWAFLIQGAWKLADFRADLGFRFSLSPIPAGPAGSEPVAVTFVGTGWAVNADAQRPDLAREYVKFMAEPGNARLYCEAEGAFSTLVGGTTTLPAEASALVAAFDAGRWAGSPAQGLDFPGAEEVMGTALQEVFLDPTTPTGDVLAALDRMPARG